LPVPVRLTFIVKPNQLFMFCFCFYFYSILVLSVYNPAITKNICEIFLGSPSGRFCLLSKSGFIRVFISVNLRHGFAFILYCTPLLLFLLPNSRQYKIHPAVCIRVLYARQMSLSQGRYWIYRIHL